MNRYAAAAGLSLLVGAAVAIWLALTSSALATVDLGLWLGNGAAGFLAAGVGMEILRPGPAGASRRPTAIYLWSVIAGLALLSLPASGVTAVAVAHRLGWLAVAVAAADYAYLAWWRTPVLGRPPEAFSDLLAPGGLPGRIDSARDAVARALVAAGPAYLFLVAVAGVGNGSVLPSRSETLLLYGWLASLTLGGALYIWPRMLAQPAGSKHLARWGAALWHAGLILSVISLRPWLLAVTGLGGLMLLADLAPTLRGVLRSRPYVVGSRRRFPKLGVRLGLALAGLLLLAIDLSPLFPHGLLAPRVLSVAFAIAANLTLVHHLRPVFGAQMVRARGGFMPSVLALASLGIWAIPRAFAAAVALASIYLAASWLPGLPLKPQRREERRSRQRG